MSQRYGLAKQKWLEGQIAWLTDTIRIMLIDTALYTPNFTTHEWFSDVPAGARVGNAGANTRAAMPALAGKTSTLGVADCADVTFTAVPPGPSLAAFVVFKDTGADGTSPILLYVDVFLGTPIYPNNGDIRFAPNIAGLFAE